MYAKDLSDLVRTVKQSIDCKSTGSTLLYIPPVPQNLYLDQLRIVATIINTVTVSPTITIGNNSPNYDNLIGATSLTSLTGVGMVMRLAPAPTYTYVGGGVGLYLKVTTAATATSFTIDCHIKGDLF